jgi:predicted PurR-regulated permease PerM
MDIVLPSRFDPLVRLVLMLLLGLACWRVLEPFFPAILFSVAIAVSTWPAYRWLLRRLRGRRGAASLLACLIVALLVIAPTVMVVLSLGDAASWLLQLLDEWRAAGPVQAPAWLAGIPVLGEWVRGWLGHTASADDSMAKALAQLGDPARKLALAGGRALGRGVGQTLFAALLLFFLYRDGELLARRTVAAARQLGGSRALELLATAQRTIAGVMFSVIGTALAQAVVATAGFAIAGVPNPVLLGALTFVLSMAPVGPPLIWGGAAYWLLRQGDTGWALFMMVYGFFGISSVDNVIKPFLISRSSHLPFALTFMGVVGGALAFGVSGVFIGPTVLALAIHLNEQRESGAGEADGAAPGEALSQVNAPVRP